MFTGQLVKTRSIKDDDVSVTRVGSFTICLKPLAVLIDLNSLLSLFQLSLTLRSPINRTSLLWLKFSKCSLNESL